MGSIAAIDIRIDLAHDILAGSSHHLDARKRMVWGKNLYGTVAH